MNTARGWMAADTSADWTFSIDIDCLGVDTFTASGVANVADLMDSLVQWTQGILRPWFGFTVFSWEMVEYSDTGMGAPVLTSSGAAFDFTPDATAQTTLGMPVEVGVFATTPIDGASGAWFPAAGVSLRGWLRNLGKGDAAGIGATRPGVPGLARIAPAVEAVVTATELARLPAVIRTMSSPRRATIWHPAAGQYRRVALGGYTQERLQGGVYRIEIAARGEVL